MSEPTSNTINGQRFSPLVEQVLRQAGWYPGRVVDEAQLEQWYAFNWQAEAGYCRIFPAALNVLREFGGLIIKQEGRGVTCHRASFSIDPLSALDIEDDNWIFDEWFLGESLFPIGWLSLNDMVAIATSGRVFSLTYGLKLWGHTFDEALEHLITGIMPVRLQVEDYERKVKDAAEVRAAVRRLYSAE